MRVGGPRADVKCEEGRRGWVRERRERWSESSWVFLVGCRGECIQRRGDEEHGDYPKNSGNGRAEGFVWYREANEEATS